MFYFHHTPGAVQWLYRDLMWSGDRQRPEGYLTFDDGPVPDATPDILDILGEHEVKATFFCVGDNVRKYPEIMERLLREGHHAGNHTFNHMDGWKVPDTIYMENVQACDDVLRAHGVAHAPFRPPYGRISRSQIKRLSGSRNIVMWDVLTGDFDRKLTGDICYRRTVPHIRNGSVIVLHDNPKAVQRTLPLLPKLIRYIKSNDWECSLL